MTIKELIDNLIGENPNQEICLIYDDKETGDKVEFNLTDNIYRHKQCIDIEIRQS